MQLNQLKIIFRTLYKQRVFTLIHIIGLSLGLMSCLFVYLFIQHELSYDAYHTHVDQTYRVNHLITSKDGVDYNGETPYPLAEALRTDFPDFKKVARTHTQGEAYLSKTNGEKFKVEQAIFAEPELLDILDFKVIQGDARKALSQPGKVVLSASNAERIFGGADPIGKSLRLDNLIDLEVAALMEDVPANSHLQADFFVSYESFSSDYLGFPIDEWMITIGGSTYVILEEGVTPDQLQQRLTSFEGKYMMDSEEDGASQTLFFQPLKDIHFDPKFSGDSPVTPINPIYLWVFGSIGLFVLAIACFNFINLSTVQAIKRGKEVGVRKVLGARPHQLMSQFLGEALLISIVSGLIAALTAQLGLTTINQLMGQRIDVSLLKEPSTWLFLALTILVVALLSGLYPAYSLARFEVSKVLKSQKTIGDRSSINLRRGLVIAQFTITLSLLIAMITISQQVSYLKGKDLGFNQEAIIQVFLPDQKNLSQLETEWMRDPAIEQIAFGLGAPISSNSIGTTFYPKGKDRTTHTHDMKVKAVDSDYLDTYGLELLEGRWFTSQDDLKTREELERADRQYTFVVNEALTKKMGYANPNEILGQELVIGINRIEAEVIGVVKDFNISSLHDEIEPTLMMSFPGLFVEAGIKIKPNDIEGTLAQIEETWSARFPDDLFTYHFLDENIAKLYESENRLFHLFQVFAGLAILIGCLGLWGLVSFITEQRTKEIGVRRVLGASLTSIVTLISKDFLRLIVLSLVIASPIAWYSMQQWLQDFAFRIHMGWSIFAIAGIIVLCIAFFTVGVQSARAALVNPVEALRDE